MREIRTAGILAILLIVSVGFNLLLVAYYITSLQVALTQTADTARIVSRENAELQGVLFLQNTTVQTCVSILFGNSTVVSPALSGNFTPVPGLTGNSTLRAPVVTRQIVEQNTPGGVTQTVVQNGSMTDVSVEIRPGPGRILVQTMPLMGIVFQDAANIAVAVAQNKTGRDLAGSDVIFSIRADNEVTSVDGPSAGALMTLITIAAIEKKTVNASVALTGTIHADGHIGTIGGVFEKAAAAKADGKTALILPRENNVTVQFIRRSFNYGGFTVIQQVPQRIVTRDYIRNNVGIEVVYVDTIDDVLAIGLQR